MNKFKVGDKVTFETEGCVGMYGEILTISEIRYGVFHFTGRLGVCSFPDKHFKLTDKGENMSRRTFRLIKDSIEMKAGALVQEACDDGNQEYKTINMEEYMLFPDWKKYFSNPSNSFSRNTVEKSPEWFEEVFPATDHWMTKEEKDNFARFLKGQTPKTLPEVNNSGAATGPYGYLYSMDVGDKKTVTNENVKKVAAAVWYCQTNTGRTFKRQRVNNTHTSFIRVS